MPTTSSANNLRDCPVCGPSYQWEFRLVVHPEFGCRHVAVMALSGEGMTHRYAWIGAYEPYKIMAYAKERRRSSRGWNSTGQIIYRVPY